MRQLVPCPGCARHIRSSEPACPFCGDSSPRSAPASRAVARSRTLIFGAALASTAVAGCPLTHTRTAAENDAGADAAVVTPTPDAGSDAAVVTPTPDAGSDAANIFPPYGTPAFEQDAGTSNADYGGPPPPEDDAGVDAGGFAPLYGGSP